MLAEAVAKQIEKQGLPAAPAVDVAAVRALAADLTEESLGRSLFELAAAARAKGLDPEGALRRHTDRVMQAVEEEIAPRRRGGRGGDESP